MFITYNSITCDAQCSHFDVDMKNPRKRYPDAVMEIFIILNGIVEVSCAGQVHVVSNKEYLCIPHSEPFYKRFVSGEPPELMRLIFWNNDKRYWTNGQYEHEMKALVPLLLNPLPVSDAFGYLLQSVKSLVPLYTYNQTGDDMQRTFMHIGESILSLLYTEQTRAAEGVQKGLSRLLHKAVGYLSAHCYEDVSVEDVARFLGVTPRHVTGLFRKNGMKPPIAFLWELRIRAAIELLECSDMPLKEIASRTGFKSVEHFHRRIKLATGQTPKAYIRSLRE